MNISQILKYYFLKRKKTLHLQSRTKRVWFGTIAQLVEQRTENPCVAGSIPAGTTKNLREIWGFFDSKQSKRPDFLNSIFYYYFFSVHSCNLTRFALHLLYDR
jgi:hypothetical protein